MLPHPVPRFLWMRAWGHWGDLNDPADGTRMTRDGGGCNGAGLLVLPKVVVYDVL